METPLTASSTTAGALLSGFRFRVPEFQREYAWTSEEVDEFWSDLHFALNDESYFLGLIILTGTGDVKDVVDGQQRLLTLTLLASALYHQALAIDRRALADRMQSTFLKSIDFETDEEHPRIDLSGDSDSRTLSAVLERPADQVAPSPDGESVSSSLISAYKRLSESLQADLRPDPFKRLGLWADFLTNRLYMAVFIHPDPASAYRVFEIVNTRGRELTTADLLKSWVLSQTAEQRRQERYDEWQRIARSFPGDNPSVLVQYIRHVVTVEHGHILPKDLYDVLAGRGGANAAAFSPDALMTLLSRHLPLYLQMIDPTTAGPAPREQLGIFSALNRIGVIAVRPALLAMANTDDALTGMLQLLRLVVRRVVVGTLGTGNVERRFGQAAKRIHEDREWQGAMSQLEDLNPSKDQFQSQVHRRSLNKNVLAFIRQSILQQTPTPEPVGFLHHIIPRQSMWQHFTAESASYWVSTIGNTFLATEERRPLNTSTWHGFLAGLLPLGVEGEWKDLIRDTETWDEGAVDVIGGELAEAAANIWYG